PFIKEQYMKFIPAVDAVLNYMQSQDGYKTMHEQIDDFRRGLRARRNLVYNELDRIEGIYCPKPEGAFYAFARVENDTFATDTEFANHLLEKTGVFVVPGSGFAPDLPGKFFRLVFLAEPAELREAMDKLSNYMHETITSHRA
ncbi:MAG: aminotransferase class I/II-fold pyridoxal phosphate-dependent enzyme, partial [Candidatus Anstonellaceae archaeon]